MRITSRPSVRSLLLTAALALALDAPAAAREQAPPDKPPQIEKPQQPAEKPALKKLQKEEPAKAPPPEEKRAEEAEPEEVAVSPEEAAINAAVEMSERLAGLEGFSVKASLAWEEVLENGEKIMSLEKVRADVSRPRGLRMERTSPGRERILFYNGERVVLWGPATRYYASAPFAGTLAELVTHLAEKYGYEIPLADLFMWGHDKAQIKAIESANYVGQDLVGGRICDHYAFRQEEADWQLWIDTGKGGLPCGYAIVDLLDPARPLFLATVEINPDADFDDKRFTFDAPKDAAEIPLATTRPVKEGPAKPEAAPEEPDAPANSDPGKPGAGAQNGKSPKKEE